MVTTIRGLAIESRLIVSPDGKFLAYAFMDNRSEPAMRLAVITVEGEPTRVLQVPGWAFERACLRWSPDGKSLQSLVTRNGVTEHLGTSGRGRDAETNDQVYVGPDFRFQLVD